MRSPGSSGSSARRRSTSSRGGLERHEVGLRQVAVVLRLLLRAQRRRRLVAGVEVHRLLHDLAARLVDLDLPLDLALDALGREVERVHVLELGARAQLVRALGPDRDVDVEAQRALLHLRVGDPELDDGLAQQLEEALRVLGGVDVRRGDDLDERRAGAVEVDERAVGAGDAPLGAAHVHVLRRVLLEVRARRSRPRASPSAVAQRQRPSTQSGSSYWEIW